jgi:23S rRNA (cytidine2498-2'-O)-methyltransferase
LTVTQGVWLLCRPGFETDAGQELVARAAEVGIYGYFAPSGAAGWVRFEAPGQDLDAHLFPRLNWRDLVFVRDWLREVTVVDPLPETDRVGAVLDALDALPEQRVFRRLEIHTPTEGAAPDLGRFARKWTAPLARALRAKGWLSGDGQSPFEELPTLEILLPDFGKAIIAAGIPGNGSPHVAGVPRLRMPREAPSRSTLKLDEAWQVFIPGDRWETLLAAGQSAVDLGAAPGGWTWQLVRRGMHVDAVDNGPMDEGLMETGQVTHWREDAFSWRPRKRVDWLVCDIVDRPGRVVELIGDWIEADAFRYAIFNLKLPMKKRWESWEQYRDQLQEKLAGAGHPGRIRARHLYHDREEITCFIESRVTDSR